ncbi:hypothetical protein CRP01_23310 [Flavilitoribacter nigricans DSM 23189 = NBRC 102662]|uniref:Uncharacterized protein n=2 Tax=Flavilitoribacter TaxID=2762562 RepID=A0A2D0N6V3_FLAN2|nr:hypothetical protein CRP01_23310 [Flavilitoribacter nigricans DSM 23189 = NBRC 102662]
MSAFALLMISCSEGEDLREPVVDLTTEWDNTTAVITQFINTLQRAQQEMQNQFAEMAVPEELTLNEQSQTQVTELRDNFQEELSSLTDLSGEISGFIGAWQSKAEKLTDLNVGLETGDLGSDSRSTLEELQETVEQGRNELESWKGELEDIQINTQDILEQFHTLIANLQGN